MHDILVHECFLHKLHQKSESIAPLECLLWVRLQLASLATATATLPNPMHICLEDCPVSTRSIIGLPQDSNG